MGAVAPIVRWTAGALRKSRQDRNANAKRVAELIQLRRLERNKPLVEQDFRNEAARSRVHPAPLHAFADVESDGSGYNANGRLKIMYEPHIVSLCSSRAYDWMEGPPELGMVLSYPKWIRPNKIPPNCKRHPYSLKQEERWSMLAFMAEVDFDAALQGCSIGMFQVLGKWWKALGYASPWHMWVSHYELGEQEHLRCALRFLDYHDVLDDMRRGEWRNVIETWNGPGNVDVYLPRFLKRLEDRRKIYR